MAKSTVAVLSDAVALASAAPKLKLSANALAASEEDIGLFVLPDGPMIIGP